MTGAIFDFNGTMFFDEAFQERSWREFLGQKTGRDVTDAEFQEYIHGRNADVSLPYFLQRSLSRQEIEDLEEEKEVIYRDLCLKSADFRLADGLPLFLDRLKQLDFPITIATASGWNNVQFFFDHLGLDRWFNLQNVVYNDGTIPGKPEPDLYLLAAERLGVDIHGCAVFEDAQSGIEAAKRAGAGKIIQAASMKQPHISRDADRVIRDYCDVDGLLAELGLGQPPENPTKA